MSCSVTDHLLFTNYLHPACSWIKWAHSRMWRVHYQPTQHNWLIWAMIGILDMRAGAESNVNTMSSCSSGEERTDFGESLSTGTQHSTHTQLSITVTTLLRFSRDQISAGQFFFPPVLLCLIAVAPPAEVTKLSKCNILQNGVQWFKFKDLCFI